MLEETDQQLVGYSLKQLNSLVDMFWAEISDSITTIEMLYENEDFKDRQLAGLVASKVYYHLGSFDNALQYALGAGKFFNVDESSEYVETIIAKCIDHYTKLQVDNFQAKNASGMKPVDSRLEDIVNRMFQRCFEDKKFKAAIGIAIETRRLDVVEKSILTSVNQSKSIAQRTNPCLSASYLKSFLSFFKTNVTETISYAYKVTLSLVQNRKFKNAILTLLVKLYTNMPNPDYVNVVQCLIYLDEPEQVAVVLENLIRADDCLMAYQLGLDLYESATQQFLLKVKNLLKALITVPQPMDTGDAESEVKTEKVEAQAKIGGDLKMYIEKLLVILGGEITIDTNMQFLIKNNHSDLLVLKTIKVYTYAAYYQ